MKRLPKYSRILLFLLLFVSINVGAQKANNLYDRGVEEYKNNQFPKAISTFSEVISISPYFIEAYVFRARTYHQLNKNDSAMTDFATALVKKPGYLPAHFFRAECNFDLKNYDLAIPDLNKVIQDKPTYNAAYVMRAKCYAAKNMIDEALTDYTYLINQGMKDTVVFYYRAQIYIQKNMPKAAIHDLESVVEIAPKHANAWYLRATLLETRDKKDEAILNYSKVLEVDENHEAARYQRARLLYETKKYDKAMEDYNYIVEKLRTKNISTFTMRGRCFGALGKYKEAEKDFTRVLERDPGNDIVFVEKAKMRMTRNDSVGSIPDLRKAIYFNEKNYEAYYLRGRILYQTKKFKDAYEDLDKSIKIQPTADALFFRALCHIEFSDKKACEDLVKADEMGSKEAKLLRKKLCDY